MPSSSLLKHQARRFETRWFQVGWFQALWLLAVAFCPYLPAIGQASQSPGQAGKTLTEQESLPELNRAARPWEFADAVGTQSGLLGQENGSFEAWVYPLKILRNFHLRFHMDKETLEGRALVRSIQTRPESTTITYAYDSFQVKETLFAPVHEPGAIVAIEINSSRPIRVEALFTRDFQLEWPGTMGSNDIEWNAALHAFTLDDSEHKFSALVGSPSATDYHLEFSSNYTESTENSLDLGTVPAGKSTHLIAIAASFQGLPAAGITYRKLCDSYPQLIAESAAYYRQYLDSHLRLLLPDAALQSAYTWAQVSMLQGLVANPYLGEGLIAGYARSGTDGRPGFAWFFGRDALWTSLALDAEGDFETTRTALAFLAKYQRSDGKITHEIAQSASFVPWFNSLPYAYAAADATPLFILVMDNYLRRSGDTAFVEKHWDNIERARQFLLSTYDVHGFSRNTGVGHGWVEGGPLLPVEHELYQASLATEAWAAFANLSQTLHHDAETSTARTKYTEDKAALNRAFWIEEKRRYAFALDQKDAQVDAPSVLAAVPMWFRLLDADKAQAMIGELASPEIQTDWGMRILASDHAKYDDAGYHSGTVWPLFTGWAATGEYRYHAALPAFANLRANALLTFDGSLGHVAEVLSGDYYQPLATASPHQIWSSAMVVSPLLTGLFGLDTNALEDRVTLSPHLPADWTWFGMQHVKAGPCELSFRYQKTLDAMTYTIERESGVCHLTLSPAVSARAEVQRVEVNGHKASYQLEASALDQHIHLEVPLADVSNTATFVSIHLRNDFGLSQQVELPALGSSNDGLRVISESWSTDHNALTLKLASAGSGSYELGVWNPGQIASVEGATLTKSDAEHGQLQLTIADHGGATIARHTVVIHFIHTNGNDAMRHRTASVER